MNRSHSIAVFAPVACAVHCMAAPILVVAAPILAPTPRMEWAFFAFTILLVGYTLLRGGGGVRTPGLTWILVACGLAVWAVSLAHGFRPLPEPATTATGALIVSGTLLWNLRRVRRASCGCSACEADPAGTGDGERRPGLAPPGQRPSRHTA